MNRSPTNQAPDVSAQFVVKARMHKQILSDCEVPYADYISGPFITWEEAFQALLIVLQKENCLSATIVKA